ncbi:MAG: 4-hydroxy-3-methylbut-2-enyl diphosphate reductase [Nanoarchaeota archaeon]|nr:4-hydroxy-3-methylbut-2-enyl diphosphate reductase [Nanoarchaeota archaeon]
MRIILARKKGMCFGVRRALDLAGKAADSGKVYTYGPLVHNKDVVRKLEKKGIIVAESVQGLKKGDIVIIRAHGISDRELEAIKQKGAEIIDATCPFVSKAKQAAKDMEKQGYKVVILGQKDHPEVKGIAESLESPIIVSSADDLKSVRLGRLGLISQTTQPGHKFIEVSEKIRSIDPDARIVNTICNATHERQESAKKTAKEADLMLVIGDKSSANTNKLTELCSEITETKHIENASELDESWFKGKKSVGITAGASTPDWIVDDVIEKLKRF